MDLVKSIRFFISRILAPISRREDDARKEYLLHIILFGSILMSGVLAVTVLIDTLVIPGDQYNGIPLVAAATIFFVFTFLLWLSRKGYARAAAYILLVLYFVPTTYTMLRWGIHLAIPILGYILIIIMSGILLGTRTAITSTMGISITVIGIAYAHTHGIIVPDYSWADKATNVSDGVEISVLLGLITILTWLSNRETEKSLRRARRSEAMLKKERNLLEVRIEERTKELKQTQLKQMEQLHKFAEFGRMTSGFFHDLVNPLTAVSLHMEHAKQGNMKDAEEIEEHITHATEALGRLEKFVEAIRKQLQQAGERTNFSLAEELHQAVDILGFKARKSSISIRIGVAEEITMWGDALKFHQVALNLLSNAIDSYDTKQTADEKIIIVSLSTVDDNVIFSVQDFGEGIAPDLLPRIFDALFTTKPQTKGIGLGLTNVKHIVEKELHGTITILSTPGEGSLFTATFPLHKNN